MNLDSKGFSIIQILMLTAVVSGVSAVMATAFDQQLQSISYIEDKMDRMFLEKELRTVLTQNTACKNSFQGMEIKPGTQKAEIKGADGKDLFNVDSLNEFRHLELNDISLETTGAIGGNSSGNISLTLNVLRKRDVRKQMLKPINISVEVQLDSNKEIVDCFVEGEKFVASNPTIPGPGVPNISIGGPTTIEELQGPLVPLTKYTEQTLADGGYVKQSGVRAKLCVLAGVKSGGLGSGCRLRYVGRKGKVNKWWFEIEDSGESDALELGAAVQSYSLAEPNVCHWICTAD